MKYIQLEVKGSNSGFVFFLILFMHLLQYITKDIFRIAKKIMFRLTKICIFTIDVTRSRNPENIGIKTRKLVILILFGPISILFCFVSFIFSQVLCKQSCFKFCKNHNLVFFTKKKKVMHNQKKECNQVETTKSSNIYLSALMVVKIWSI